MVKREQLIAYLQKKLSPERLNHCCRVEETALQLAQEWAVDLGKVSQAALLHDICREHPEDSLLQLASKFGILIDEIEGTEPLLLHGFVGAALVKMDLEITDREVLEAISYHVTGAPGLSSVGQAVFVADFIEPGRNFEAARRLRAQWVNLSQEQLLLGVYNSTLAYLIAANMTIHPLSVAGRNELIMKGVSGING